MVPYYYIFNHFIIIIHSEYNTQNITLEAPLRIVLFNAIFLPILFCSISEVLRSYTDTRRAKYTFYFIHFSSLEADGQS